MSAQAPVDARANGDGTPPVTPVFDIDIAIRRGSFSRTIRITDASRVIALVGASGAGKTSVLHAIAGLSRPERGHITIGGRVLFDAARRIDVATHQRRIGYVFQDTRLFPHLDVAANLRYGRHGAAPPHQRHQATHGTHSRHDAQASMQAEPRGAIGFDDAVALLGIEALLQRRTANLSGGEAQRVALGRALLSQPELLLLDEPLSMLDQARRAELIPYLQRVRDRTALPIIYVSHAADEIEQLTNAVHHLD